MSKNHFTVNATNCFPPIDVADLGSCYLRKDAAGLMWDAICFVFLLLQLRVYRSHYFRHVVTDLTVRNKLAAR